MEIEQYLGGFTQDESAIVIYKIITSRGESVSLCNVGASVMAIEVLDKNGGLVDVALGYKNPADYIGDSPYMGKTPGRFSNRIADGRFTLDGVEYLLKQNNGRNHLHGGAVGFADKLWLGSCEGDSVVFQLTSPSGDEGYPAELQAEVVYSFSEDALLSIELLAESDGATVVNLTNHSYFNLSGESSGTAMDNILQIKASHYLPTDKGQIPTGKFDSVEGTPMDFREPKAIGRDVDADFVALDYGYGYDHCYVVDNHQKGLCQHLATLSSEKTGIKMEVHSTQVGLQLYSGNFLQGCPVGKSGKAYRNREGVALECQALPDSPNQSGFPSTRLDAGDRYHEKIIYKFSLIS